MTAMPAPQTGRAVELGADRRRSRRAVRRQSDLIVSVTVSSGEQAEAAVRNVSTFGCNLQSNVPWLRLGRFITIGFEGERAIKGIVRWVRDGFVGIEFLRAISTAEAQAIATREV